MASRKEVYDHPRVLVISDYSPTAEPKRTSTALSLSSKIPMGPPFCHTGPSSLSSDPAILMAVIHGVTHFSRTFLTPKEVCLSVPLDLQTIHNGVAISEKDPLKWVACWDLSPCYCFLSILLHFLLRNYSVFLAAPPVCCPFPSKPQYWVRVVPWVGSGSTAFKAAESKDNYFPQFIVSDTRHTSGRKFC